MKILADASLPMLQHYFASLYQLTTYQNEASLKQQLQHHDILLCRSTLKVDAELLANTPIRYVATASSGSDHLDKSFLEKQAIQYIDAKGCNAISVADYITASLAYLLQHQKIKGMHAGLIGYGAVGKMVAKRLIALGFYVSIYDPLIKTTDFKSCSLTDLYACDVLLLHANLHHNAPYASHHLVNDHFLSQLSSNTVIMNAARGELVDEDALIRHLPRLIYCTDVYVGEPHISADIVQKATLCTPHIAGHSIEAKINAVRIIAEKLDDAIHKQVPRLARDKETYSTKILPDLPERSNVPSAPIQEGSPITQHNLHNILSLYNPLFETQALKASNDLAATFLTLRKAHQFRHDFTTNSGDL